jgi:type II secretory pathway component PulF
MVLIDLAEKFNLVKFPAAEKFYLLNYIKAISSSGQDEKKAIESKIKEYEKRKKYIPLHMLKKVKIETEKGKKFAEALFTCNVITPREYHILKNSKGSIASGIEKILEINKKSSKSVAGFMLMLIPPAIMLLALLFSHGKVKGILENMLEPIKSSGATPPPIKEYLLVNTDYIIANAIFFSLVIFVFGGLAFIKKYRPKKYLTIFPIIEEEYVIDILKSIKTISAGGGINISNTAKALATGETNNIKRMIFEEIVERTAKGKEKISEIFEEFGANYNTVSSLKIGEDANNINIGLDIAIEDLESRYNRDISLFLKAGMWIGQLSMIGIAGKPMIDIMLLLSVGQLNFQV